MTQRKQAIDLCLSFEDVFEDYPFDDNWTAMRHKSNKKTFAFIFRHKGQIWVNVKALPEYGAVWRSRYAAVTEAYHMNKLHWIGIVLDGSLEDSVIAALIGDSYSLTLPKNKQKRQSTHV